MKPKKNRRTKWTSEERERLKNLFEEFDGDIVKISTELRRGERSVRMNLFFMGLISEGEVDKKLIKHLKRILSETVPMWSVIVFSDECTFKDVTVSSDKPYKVVQLRELKSLVNSLIKKTDDDLFSESDIQWMYDELLPFTMEDEELKKRHIDNIFDY